MTTSTLRRSLCLFVLALCVALSAIASSARTQEPEWLVKPTEEHKILQEDVGTWDATVKIFIMEGAEPIESKGTEKNELLQGGLWLVSRFEGEAGGMPFTGVGTTGYDPVENKYVGTWVDSMTPHLMISKGDYDADTKTFTFTGEGRDPQSKEVYHAKLIARYNDDGTRTFEMHMPGENGKHWKMMEIRYKRRAE